MKKRIFAGLLAVLMLTGCAGGSNSDYPVKAKKFSLSAQKQIELIADNSAIWLPQDEYGLNSCAVTDLDRNGRLEVIVPSLQGTGLYTYTEIYEVSEDGKSLVHLGKAWEEFDSEADIGATNSASVYYDSETDRMYYLLTDSMRNGVWGGYESTRAFWLENGMQNERYISAVSTYYADEESDPVVSYSDGEGNEITEEEYYSAVGAAYGELPCFIASFEWFSLNEDAGADLSHDGLIKQLTDSYNGFSISRAGEQK